MRKSAWESSGKPCGDKDGNDETNLMELTHADLYNI